MICELENQIYLFSVMGDLGGARLVLWYLCIIAIGQRNHFMEIEVKLGKRGMEISIRGIKT